MADRSPETDLDRDSSLVLELALPISANEMERMLWKNRRRFSRERRQFQRSCWQSAVMQSVPPEQPAPFCHVHALMRVWGMRDEDKVGKSLSWIIDALKQKQPGKGEPPFRFTKQGLPIYVERGYYVDDDPAHMKLDIVQVVDRKNMGVTLTITAG